MKMNPLLMCDFYKVTHVKQYPDNITKLVSYYTPRMSRLKDDKVVAFGFQGFVKEYLMETFDEYFFSRPEEDIVKEYHHYLDSTIGEEAYDLEKVVALHRLGYLPLRIRTIKEGTRVPMKVPMLEIQNTHDDFAWLVNAVETLMSCSLWHMMVCANVGYSYRQIVNHYYAISVDDSVPRSRALGDFSMRGQHSEESAVRSSSAFCLSFLNTATVPTIAYLENYYNCDCTKEPVVFGAISTEHSVMTSNYAVDGDEVTFVKRLLTQIYKNQSFSMVSDSYDYWNLVDNILPQCKKEILEHNGTLLIRGDSGDPVDIVTKTVYHLWDIFGGTINEKGFKVLNPKVKAIYGDSITPQRAMQIYEKLISKGFACNNVSLGVGSFSMMCLVEDNMCQPFTRDTYGVAVKSTYGEKGDFKFKIFKDPITDTGKFKKSQKGLCVVYKDEQGEITYQDGYLNDEEYQKADKKNLLKTIFEDGHMVEETSLKEIRNTLHDGAF